MGFVLSGVTVVTMSEVGVTLVVVVVVTGVLVPSVPGVGVVTVAVLVILPVDVLLTVPLISTEALAPAAISDSVTLPFHACQVAPLSRLYCGFCTSLGTVSLTVGVLAMAGPSLITVTV